MGMILTGIVVAIVIAVGAGYFLSTQEQQPTWQVLSSSSTRVDDPGHNLVGPGWTGEGVVEAEEEAD